MYSQFQDADLSLHYSTSLKLACFLNSVHFKILQLIFVEIIDTIYLVLNFLLSIFRNTINTKKKSTTEFNYNIMTNFSILETPKQKKTTRARYVYLTSAGTGVSVGILDVRYIAPWYLSVCQWLVLITQ